MNASDSTDEMLTERVGRTVRMLKWVGITLAGILIYLFPFSIGLVAVGYGEIFGEPPDWLSDGIEILVYPALWLYDHWTFYQKSIDLIFGLGG